MARNVEYTITIVVILTCNWYTQPELVTGPVTCNKSQPVSRIRAVSRRQTGQMQTELAAGALRLDPVRHLLWLRNEAISVSPKEFALLNELMLEPDAVISREQLEDRLYGWDEEVASNAVEVHIYNLRKKLGAEVIRTIRGVGYRIGDDA